MTSDQPLSHTLAELGKIRTPIIYDAVEKFEVRARTDGLMDTTIRAQLPSLGPMIGYAATAKLVGTLPRATGERSLEWRQVWDYMQQAPAPTVAVVQDLDQPPAKCCAWGDVSASLFLKLGAVGAVTNGGVRDLPEVETLGFQLFAPSPVVGHAHTRWVEIDTPVTVGSLVVYPGDLIHGDEHGVMVIPKEIDPDELLQFTREFLLSEKTVVDYNQGPDFNLDTFSRLLQEHEQRTQRSGK